MLDGVANLGSKWKDYELTLNVWQLVGEGNRRYTEQNSGELVSIQFNAKGISQGEITCDAKVRRWPNPFIS